jgi:type I restriction enzyme S subunit
MSHKLPEGWEENNLGNLLELVRNGSTAKQDINSSKYRVTRIETISNGRIDVRKTGLTDDSSVIRYKLEVGDILFSHINSVQHIAKTAIVDNPLDLYHGMNLLVLRCDKKVLEPKFLYMILNKTQVRNKFRNICKQAINQASLNIKDINSSFASLK